MAGPVRKFLPAGPSCCVPILLLASVLVLIASFAAAQGNPLDFALADYPTAKAFCASSGFKQLTCGFASDDEDDATLRNNCVLCGTTRRGVPKNLPAVVEGVDRYSQLAVRAISLACKGPLVVRSVFKVLAQNAKGWDGTDCSNSRLVPDSGLNGVSPKVVRCELELPSGGGSEAERALKAKEARCWICGWCDEGAGCPGKSNTWYSDSFVTNNPGCDLDPKVGYVANRASISINPSTKILLAKFEACNNPGCFDPKAEQAKLAAAKPCVKGLCA